MATSNSNISRTEDKPTFDFTKQSWKDDATFIVEGKRLYASKSVLALFSPVFESMFGSNFKEKEDNVVELPGKTVDAFLEFLHCLYPNSNKSVTEENVFKVLPLADEYQVLTLVEKCKNTLEIYLANQEDLLSVRELLQYYNVATRHGLSEVKRLSVEEVLNAKEFDKISTEAEDIMDKDTLLEFKSNIIAQQADRLDEVTTKFVKSCLVSNTYSSGFENARGAIIEFKIANVFDSNLQFDEYSKPVKIWNASFNIQVSVFQNGKNEKSERYLSVYICCSLPGDNWSCEVEGEIVLENVFAIKNQKIARKSISNTFKSPDSLAWGYESFEKLSKFLIGIATDVDDYTGKVVAYILAKQPVAGTSEKNK